MSAWPLNPSSLQLLPPPSPRFQVVEQNIPDDRNAATSCVLVRLLEECDPAASSVDVTRRSRKAAAPAAASLF